MPGCLLMPIFLICGAFWVFGPSWSWIPFNFVFGLLAIITMIAGPSRITYQAPSAAQWTSSTFSLTLFLSIAIGIGLLFKERYWEIVLCVIVLLISAIMWPKLRTLGPL